MLQETDEQFHQRLLAVIAQAETRFFEAAYCWQTVDPDKATSSDALARIADGDQWFEFVPAEPGAEQSYYVVQFRFSEQGPSAIGFVAWLHSNLRTMGQTGAIVICGKDQRDSAALFDICQGVMDYWACPVGPAGERFLKVINDLIESGS